MNENLELKMYFFVPYQLSGIQQAIQAGHAALEYANKATSDSIKKEYTQQFREFMKNWKTWIILNGGTTNSHPDYLGSLNQIQAELLVHDAFLDNEPIFFSYFHEPDLEGALTAICFICDERVFNYEDYPDLVDYLISNTLLLDDQYKMSHEELKEVFPKRYGDWEKSLGGKKNVFLRNLLKGKKLA